MTEIWRYSWGWCARIPCIDISTRQKVHATWDINIRLLPKCFECVVQTFTIRLDNDRRYFDLIIANLLCRVCWQFVYVNLELIVDELVPSVERWISDCRSRIAHHAKRLQVTMFRIVRVWNECVPNVMNVAVIFTIDRCHRRFHHISQQIDPI